MSELLFYLLSTCLILSSMSVALSAHPMRSILSLIAAFLTTSVMWLNLGAEFLALALLFVYVGSVMVLFLFVAFMLNVDKLESIPLVLKGLTLILFFGFLYYLFGKMTEIPSVTHGLSDVSNTKALGVLLFKKYVYAFEVLGCVLVATMVAVIQMVETVGEGVKTQNIRDQVNREKKDCITWME